MASAVVSSTLNMAQAWAAELQRASANHANWSRQGSLKPCRDRSLVWGRVTGMEIPGASAETSI
jgi:hypothetical protein